MKIETLIAETIEERNRIIDSFYEKIAEEGWLDYSFDLSTDSKTGFMTIRCTFLEKKPEYVHKSNLHM